MSNSYPKTTIDTTEFVMRMNEKHNSRPRLTKRGKALAWVAGISLAAAAGTAGVAVHKANSAPELTYTGVADTYPNAYDGGKAEIKELLKDEDSSKAEAASHIDATELSEAIADTVYDATGEDERHIQGIKTVSFTFNQNGDIIDSKLVDDSTKPEGK